MKETILEPMLADERALVQFTGTVTIDKGLFVNVPNGYQAIALIDERAAFRIPPCVKKKIAEYDKHYLGKQCKIAFVRTKPLASMMYGFGNVPIRNEKLGESYRIGANGTYTVEIVDIPRLVQFFELENVITIDQVRERTIAVIKQVGNSVLGTLFGTSEVAAFEASMMSDKVRKALTEVLEKETAFSEMGVRLKELTVNSVHVNEDDLEEIRSNRKE